MKTPCLIVETPRAGPWNHLFLVSTAAADAEAIASRFMNAAREKREGVNFLARGRQVTQVAQPTNQRTGDEILVLAGVDVGKLSEQERQRVERALEDRLSDLGRLITESIDWNTRGGRTVAVLSELGEWLEQDFKDLPPSLVSDRPVLEPLIPHLPVEPPQRKSRTGRLFLLFGSLVAIVLAGLYLYDMMFVGEKHQNATNANSAKEGTVRFPVRPTTKKQEDKVTVHGVRCQ